MMLIGSCRHGGEVVQVHRKRDGTWRVTYGGFVTCESSELRLALRETCGPAGHDLALVLTEQGVRELALATARPDAA